MFNCCVLLTGRADRSKEAFEKHWREVHAPLVLGFRESIVRSYQLGFVRPDPLRGAVPCRWSGIAELWFDSQEALQSLISSSLYREHMLPDELNFLSHVELLNGTERVHAGRDFSHGSTPTSILVFLSASWGAEVLHECAGQIAVDLAEQAGVLRVASVKGEGALAADAGGVIKLTFISGSQAVEAWPPVRERLIASSTQLSSAREFVASLVDSERLRWSEPVQC